MGVSVKKGTFVAATATGDQAITDVGFQGKAVVIWGVERTATGYGAGLKWFFGAATASGQQWGRSGMSDDAAATSNTARVRAATVVTMLAEATGPTNDAIASFVSWDSDGFTINWSNAPTSAMICHYMVIGGSDVLAWAGESDQPAAIGDAIVTGVGFTPKAALACSIFANTTPTANHNLLMGMATGIDISQGALAFRDGDGQATTLVGNAQEDGDFLIGLSSSADSILLRATVASWNSDGVTINYSATPGVAVSATGLLLLGGNAAYQVQKALQPAATGDVDTSFGSNLKGVIGMSANNVAGAGVVTTSGRFTIGGSDGTNEGHVWWRSVPAAADSDVDQRTDDTKFMGFATGPSTTDAECDVSFIELGLRASWTTADATQREMMLLGIGEPYGVAAYASRVADSGANAGAVPLPMMRGPRSDRIFGMQGTGRGMGGARRVSNVEAGVEARLYQNPTPYPRVVVDMCGFNAGAVSQDRMLDTTTGGTVTETTSGARTGRALRVNRTSAQTCKAERYVTLPGFPPSMVQGALTAYIKFDALPTDGSQEIFTLRIDGAGGAWLYGKVEPGTGNLSFQYSGGATSGSLGSVGTGVWNRMEVTWDHSTATNRALVSLNGGPEVEITWAGAAGLQVDGWMFGTGGTTASTYDMYVDDLVVVSGFGRLGYPVAVHQLTPNGDVDSAWSIVGGAATRWESIDEYQHDNTTTYIESSTSGQVQRVGLTTRAIASNERVLTVCPQGNFGTGAVTGTHQVFVYLENDAGQTVGPSTWAGDLVGWRPDPKDEFQSAPSGGYWGQADVDEMKLRFVKDTNADVVRITNAWVDVAVATVLPAVGITVILGAATSTHESQVLGRAKRKLLGEAVGAAQAQVLTPGTPAQIIPLGVATTTEQAQAVAHLKLKALGAVTGVEQAQALTRRKARAVGVATTLSTAELLTRRKTRALGATTSVEQAQAIARSKAKLVGAATTVEQAQTLLRRKIRAVGAATSVEQAQALARTKARALAAATGVEQAQALVRRKMKALGVATTVEQAQVVRPAHVLALGTATGTEQAQPIAKRKLKALGAATTVEQAQPLARLKARLLGAATGTNVAEALARSKAKLLGAATGVEQAQPLSRRKTRSVGAATGVGEAQPLSKRKTRALGAATGAGEAQVLRPGRRYALGTVTGADVATTLGRLKARLLGAVTGAAEAQPIDASGSRTVALLAAVQDNQAQPIAHRKLRLLGATTGVSQAQVVRAVRVRAVGAVTGVSQAQAMAHRKLRALGAATQDSQAQPMSRRKLLALLAATTLSAAQSLTRRKAKLLGAATGAEQAQALTHRKTRALTTANTLSSAQALSRLAGLALGEAAQPSVAQALTHRKTRELGAATQDSQALPMARIAVVLLGAATQPSVAEPLHLDARRLLREAVGVSLAQPLVARLFVLVVPATVTSTVTDPNRVGATARTLTMVSSSVAVAVDASANATEGVTVTTDVIATTTVEGGLS